jgi:hypothetical protein
MPRKRAHRLHRRARGLDHSGSRAPTLDRVWPAAHRGFHDDAVAYGWNVALSLAGYAVAFLIIYPSGLLVIAYLVRRSPSDIEHWAPVEVGQPRSPTRHVAEAAGDLQ